jgi:hypothetical protein
MVRERGAAVEELVDQILATDLRGVRPARSVGRDPLDHAPSSR